MNTLAMNALRDLRFALRQLRRAPGFAITVVLTLGLSVGVATAVFCVVDAVILRPLPYDHPERIVNAMALSQSGYQQPNSWPAYQDERRMLHGFAAFAGFDNNLANLELPTGAVRLRAITGTDNFFDVFGVKPRMGRTFLPGEDQPGRGQVVVLGFDTWKRFFAGQRDIVGQTIRVDGESRTVVGVMPAGFRFPLNLRNGIYMPMVVPEWGKNRGSHWLATIGRLKEGVSLDQAQAERNLVLGQLAKQYPDYDQGRRSSMSSLDEATDKRSRGPLYTLIAAALAVLAIGCVNVAGLLLARGIKREREMTMRVAIGAGRARLLGQLLTEGVVLALLGAATGVGLAWVLLRLMRVFLEQALARGGDIQLNGPVLAIAAAIAVLTSLAASLIPALRLTGVEPNRALKSGGAAGTSRDQRRVFSGFVVTQMALTLLLLVVAGLLIRVVTKESHTDLGFDPNHVLTAAISVSPGNYQQKDVLMEFYYPLLDRIRQIPGVEAAGIINRMPIDSWGTNSDVHITGQPPYPPQQEMLAEMRYITPGYLDAMGIRLKSGRLLSASLDPSTNKSSAILVNEAFVRKFIPNGLDPIGQHLDDSDKADEKSRIVGVVSGVRQALDRPPMAEMDYLADEIPPKDRIGALSYMSLAVRTSGDPKLAIPAIRSAFQQVDRTVPFENPEVMTEIVADQLVFERMESWLFGIFAGLALLLAMVGLYGLVSHEVEQGTRDIGVRMALGATRGRILAMVLRRVALLLAVGAAVGLGLTVLTRQVIGMVIYFDPQKEVGEFALPTALLLAAGIVAALIPAGRAASVEPMQALRSE